MDSKQELILAGALRRFMHFGINKTTMNEIADDLSMSKPSLYYYFPDKSALVYAVAEKIIGEYTVEVNNIFEEDVDFEHAMMSLIEFRYRFLKKYFMLHIGERESDQLKNDKMQCLIHKLKEHECDLITDKLCIAHAKGCLCIDEPKSVAELFLDSMMGLKLFLHMQNIAIPNQEAFEKLQLKQKQLAEIFINGIKDNRHGATNSR